MKNDPQQTSLGKRLTVSILIILGLFIVSSIVALILVGDTTEYGGNTAHITISGPIYGDVDEGLFGSGATSSTEIVAELEEARDDDTIEAVLIEINSPGGSAVASDEIATAVKDVRAANKTVVAWIREGGASGAYWIASSTDHIVANRMSITGSIGVISSYLQFDRFLNRYNVTYNRLVAGEQKDIGDPFTELTPEDKAFMQHKLNRVHQYFIDEVATNRNMSRDKVAKLADGQFFLGIEAYNEGLIDELGGKEEAIRYIEQTEGITVELVDFAPEESFFDQLLGILGKRQRVDVTALAQNGLETQADIEMRAIQLR